MKSKRRVYAATTSYDYEWVVYVVTSEGRNRARVMLTHSDAYDPLEDRYIDIQCWIVSKDVPDDVPDGVYDMPCLELERCGIHYKDTEGNLLKNPNKSIRDLTAEDIVW